MQGNIQTHQISGFRRGDEGAITPKTYQQDTLVAGLTPNHINDPQIMVDLLLDVQDSLAEDAPSYDLGFDVVAEINSIHSDGKGRISIVNGNAGDSATYVLLLDRNQREVAVLSEGANKGPIGLGAHLASYDLQSVTESTNRWNVDLQDGQELYVLAVSDGVPMQQHPLILNAAPDQPLLEQVKSHLIDTPSEDVNLAKFLIDHAEALGTKDNASVAVQSFTKESLAGNSMIAVFDASDGTDKDMARFRQRLDDILAGERYSGPVLDEHIADDPDGTPETGKTPEFSPHFF